MPPSEAASPRVSDLIGCPVRSPAGEELGEVTDVRLRPHRPYGAAVLRVEAVLIDRRHVGRLFGYERRRQQGPWLLRAIIRRVHRNARLVPWADVESARLTGAEREIRLRAGYRATSPLEAERDLLA